MATTNSDPASAGRPELLPLDKHNQKLANNVHPEDWVNPSPKGRYNLVVLGGGSAGLVTAAGAAGLGAKVALIERNLLGGDCLNVGCVPSKAIIRAAHAAAEVRDAGALGVCVPDGVSVDFSVVMERMRRLRAEVSPNDSAARFRDLGIDVFFGSARFLRDGIIAVGDTELRYAKAVIATGARATALPIPGLDTVDYLTNETLFSLTELPKRLGVIGAGPVGCEMAQSFARFGSEVFLVESSGGVLPREDRDAAAVVQAQMVRDGVQILCCGRNLEVYKDEEGTHLKVDTEQGHYDELVDTILVGAGRSPNVEGLGLEGVGVEFDRSGVKVDPRLRTTNKRIYAAGDICFPLKFTHTADAMARIVIGNALFWGRSKTSSLTIPWATYTAPELAQVGLTAEQAKAQGVAVDTYRVDMKDVDRALLEGEDDGFLKVHVKKGSDRIVGATVVARNGGELISELSLAMTNGLGLGAIAGTIHPYPTQAEVIKRAGDAYNRTRLKPWVARVLDRLLAWQR